MHQLLFSANRRQNVINDNNNFYLPFSLISRQQYISSDDDNDCVLSKLIASECQPKCNIIDSQIIYTDTNTFNCCIKLSIHTIII
jgi:hypothetical protein